MRLRELHDPVPHRRVQKTNTDRAGKTHTAGLDRLERLRALQNVLRRLVQSVPRHGGGEPARTREDFDHAVGALKALVSIECSGVRGNQVATVPFRQVSFGNTIPSAPDRRICRKLLAHERSAPSLPCAHQRPNSHHSLRQRNTYPFRHSVDLPP